MALLPSKSYTIVAQVRYAYYPTIRCSRSSQASNSTDQHDLTRAAGLPMQPDNLTGRHDILLWPYAHEAPPQPLGTGR